MNRAVIAAITTGTVVILVFAFFLFALVHASQEVEEPPLLSHHYTLSHILRPEPSVTIHNSVSY